MSLEPVAIDIGKIMRTRRIVQVIKVPDSEDDCTTVVLADDGTIWAYHWPEGFWAECTPPEPLPDRTDV